MTGAEQLASFADVAVNSGQRRCLITGDYRPPPQVLNCRHLSENAAQVPETEILPRKPQCSTLCLIIIGRVTFLNISNGNLSFPDRLMSITSTPNDGTTDDPRTKQSQ